MFLLVTPIFFYGTVNHDGDVFISNRHRYAENYKCDEDRDVAYDNREYCKTEEKEHAIAFVLLSFAQLLSGVASSPFNTLAYVRIFILFYFETFIHRHTFDMLMQFFFRQIS